MRGPKGGCLSERIVDLQIGLIMRFCGSGNQTIIRHLHWNWFGLRQKGNLSCLLLMH